MIKCKIYLRAASKCSVMGVNTATLHITVSHTLHTFTHHNDKLNRSVELMRDRVRGVGFGEDLAAWKLYNNGEW